MSRLLAMCGPANRMGDEEDPRSDSSDNDSRKGERKGKDKGKGMGKTKSKALGATGFVEVGGKSAEGKT